MTAFLTIQLNVSQTSRKALNMFNTYLPFQCAAQVVEWYEPRWHELQPRKDLFPLKRVEYRKSEWYPLNNEESVALFVSFNLDDISDRFFAYHIRDNFDNAFLYIKPEQDALESAIKDVMTLKDNFPMFNKNLSNDDELPWYACKIDY